MDSPVAQGAAGSPGTLDQQISAVHTIARLLSSTLDLDERLQAILAVSMDAVGAVAGSILLYRSTDEQLVFRYVVGPKARELTGYAMPATDGVAGGVFATGEPAITNTPSQVRVHRADVSERVGFHTDNILTVPLKHRGDVRPVGVMQLVNKKHGEFGERDLEVLEIIAAVAATAIENARLVRDAQLAAVAHAVGDLSHDIKNKVTPISLSVDTLWPMLDELYSDLDRTVAALSPEAAERVGAATGFVRDLYPETFAIIKDQVQEIQDYTKLIADALKGSIAEPQLELYELAPVIEEQVKGLEPVARAHSVSLVCECAPMPPCRFDRFLVERAVYNLVNNAIPETPPGGTVTVRSAAEPEGAFPDGGRLIISVTDTGRGMPPDVLHRIFHGQSKSTKKGGTGLGTRIVYNAVASHKGRFEGESCEGKGTTFRMLLPLVTE